jgi:hypothetical protein
VDANDAAMKICTIRRAGTIDSPGNENGIDIPSPITRKRDES